METSKVLVTGAAGFMGSWVVDELVAAGQDVVAVDNLLGGFSRNVNKAAKFLRIDLRDKSKVDAAVKGVDTIFHLAAYAAEGQSFFSPIAINDINITPLNNLLVAAVNNGARRFVFTSSMAVYGDQKPPFGEDMPRRPVDPYGAAKQYCEIMLEIFSRVHGLEYTIIRPHNVYGPRQNISDPYRNVLGIWINRIMRGKPPVIYGDGNQTRAFSYIEDIVHPVARAGFLPRASGQVVNMGSDEVITINAACRIVLETMASNMKPIHAKERPGEVKNAYCTVDKSTKLLGYHTRHTLAQGVTKMVEWAKNAGPQEPSYRLPLEITRNAPGPWLSKSM
jgi:UDP-glucose 4-epimerase